MTQLVYLASPYSPVDKTLTFDQERAMRRNRFVEVSRQAAKLMDQGFHVFCPIAHSHSIEEAGFPDDRRSGDWWLQQDFAILKHCDMLMVYKMPDWEKSYGIAKEIEFAKANGIPILYLEH